MAEKNIEDNHIKLSQEDKKIILEVLLKDFELMRAEAKDVAASHWKYSVPFALSIITTFIASFYKAELIFLVPLFILAQFAAVLNNHYGYIYLLSSYIKVIEKKINEIISLNNLVEYENEFVHRYFSGVHPKLYFRHHKIIEKPQPVLETLMLVPSFIIYLWSITGILIQIFKFNLPKNSRIVIMISVIILFFAALKIIYDIYFKGFTKLRDNMEQYQKEVLKRFREQIYSLIKTSNKL